METELETNNETNAIIKLMYLFDLKMLQNFIQKVAEKNLGEFQDFLAEIKDKDLDMVPGLERSFQLKFWQSFVKFTDKKQNFVKNVFNLTKL